MGVSRPAAIAACLLIPCVAHAAPVYSLRPIPAEAGVEVRPNSINDRGEITGYINRNPSGGNNGPDRPFVWDGSGPLRPLAVPAGTVDNVMGIAINNRGEVLGQIGQNMVVWSADGTAQTIPPPAGYQWVLPSDINDAGTVVAQRWQDGVSSAVVRRHADGSLEVAPTSFRPAVRSDLMNQAGSVVGSDFTAGSAVVWDPDGTVRALAAPPGGGASPSVINNTGLIAGRHGGLDDQGNAFVDMAVWRPDGTVSIVTPYRSDVSSLEPTGINDRGEVVAYLNLNNHANDAVYWSESDGLRDLQAMLDASGAGWDLQWASGINSIGQIIGIATFQGGGFQGVLLTPVPEPGAASFGLLLFGFISARALGRRRCPARRTTEITAGTASSAHTAQ